MMLALGNVSHPGCIVAVADDKQKTFGWAYLYRSESPPGISNDPTKRGGRGRALEDEKDKESILPPEASDFWREIVKQTPV